MTDTSGDMTQLLHKWQEGDSDAKNELFSRMYLELKRISSSLIVREGRISIVADDLLNEGVIRLIRLNRMDWQNRAHFLAMAARVMRRVLVDHARAQASAKRGHIAVTLVTGIGDAPQEQLDIDRLEKALVRLTQIDPQRAAIVELRYFGGLSLEETAEVVGISPSSVKRSWRASRAWLHAAMEESRDWSED
ncbi:ECF-type sigma factor [Ponticaulis profundi]|uniref:ECF-type sigma factor n=1 Tax=Ponticaulis profundi TaxID=2665222 RepID=A0ABW1S7R4_9PROT